jgi:hypothetical protein
MLSQEERARLLDEALSRVSVAWRRETFDRPVELLMEVMSPTRPDQQRLAVLLRRDGDIQIEYHVAGKRGSPFELLLGPCDEYEKCVAEAARIVADLLAERLLLAYDRGFFKSGNRFVEPSEVTPEVRDHLKWSTSWHGSHDFER